MIRRRTGGRERQRECQHLALAFDYSNAVSPAALAKLSYEFLIRQLIGYRRGCNPIEKSLYL